jgi:hypothetical protein
MANTSMIAVSPDLKGLVHLELSGSVSTKKLADLLQQNHDKYHV